MNIIINDSGNQGYYGSRCQAICIVHSNHTSPRGTKRVNFNPIKGPVLNNDMNLHLKRDSLNLVPQVLAEKIINVITINDFIQG